MDSRLNHMLRGCWLAVLLAFALAAHAGEPLPSWRQGAAREAIVSYVQAVTRAGGPDYIVPAQRIAVFDNDGTLWSEQPMYFEVLFAFDEVRRLAPQHPGWKQQQPYRAVLENDHAALAATGMKGLMEIVGATHTGVTSAEFLANAQRWLAQAVHPKSGRPYTEMVFQPMLELLAYLRENGFKLFIVSGGEVTFMRAFAEEVYGIPPEQVIGTTFASRFQDNQGALSIVRLATLAHNDDGPGKPESIEAIIGRRPVFAFGNSDGDLQMLQWTMAGDGRRFAGLVHHTDGQREWAYDRNSNIGRLDQALNQARRNNWVVVDMAADWSRVYPGDPD